MAETPRSRAHLIKLVVRPSVKAGLLYFVLLNALFFPALWGTQNLMASAAATPSILPTGASHLDGTPVGRLRDPGAPAWQFEPGLAFTHDIVFGEGKVPWWNPYQGFGSPWAAGMIQQTFYLPTVLASIHPSPRAVAWFVVLRLFMAGLLAYAYLRYFLGPMPSTAGGLIFMLSGYFVINLNLDNLSTDTLTPLALIGFEAILRSGSARSFLLCIGSVWLILISGMPESAFVILIFGGAYFLFRILTFPSRRTSALRLIGDGVISSVLAFLLSAFLLIPMLEFLRNGVDTHRGAPQGLASVTLARDILVYVLPLLTGPLYSAEFLTLKTRVFGYFGVGPVVLAFTAALTLFGNFLREQRTVILFFTLALGLSAAKYFGFSAVQWVGTLPLFQLVDFPQYLQPVLALCIAVLAAYGTDCFLKLQVRTEMLIALGALCVIGCNYLFEYEKITGTPGEPARFLNYSVVVGGCTAAAMFVIALSTAFFPSSSRGMSAYYRGGPFAAILAILITELSVNYIYPVYYYLQTLPSVRSNPYRGAPYLDFVRKSGIGFDRVFARGGDLYPDWASAFRLFDSRFVSGISPGRLFPLGRAFFKIQPALGAELLDRFTGDILPYSFSSVQERRFLQLSSTRFVVSPSALVIPPSSALIEQVMRQNPMLAQTQAAHFKVTQFTIQGDSRQVLFEHPPMMRVPLRVRIPADRFVLRFSPSMDPGLFESKCGDGVHFVLEVASSTGSFTRLYERYIDPKHNVGERQWLDDSVDLQRFAGREVTLLFSTDGGPKGDADCDWAGWANLSFDTRDASDKALPDLKLVYDSETKVYQYSHPLPRAGLYQSVEVTNNEKDALDVISNPGFDLASEASVVGTQVSEAEARLLQKLKEGKPALVLPAEIMSYTSDRVRVHTNSDRDEMMMLNDTFFPGWNVYVDKQKRTLLQADYNFRGVLVEKGPHEIDFRYEPSSVNVGSSLSFVALLSTTALAFIRRRKARAGPRIIEEPE